jgi:hypothetical protein
MPDQHADPQEFPDTERLFEESDQLAAELFAVIGDLPLANGSEPVRVADLACSLSLEHWFSARILLQGALLPSALVVHRAQFEALTRSIWLTYAATDENIGKFTADLSLDSEQAAKNSPGVDKMMQQIAARAPKPAHDGLLRFKDQSWRALNSYAHAGIHPLRRHEQGYPIKLVRDVLGNVNGLAVFSCMQAVILRGAQPLQQEILDISARYPDCTPAPL